MQVNYLLIILWRSGQQHKINKSTARNDRIKKTTQKTMTIKKREREK
jgi:hypothetical protein